MKLVVLNYSGNVGKTMLAKHLLLPRLTLDYIYVGEPDQAEDLPARNQLKAEGFGYIQDFLLCESTALIDVASSETAVFMEQMRQYRGSHEDCDYFIVPTTSEFQVMRKTAITLNRLLDIGVSASQIRLVFNKSRHHSKVALVEFDYLIKIAQQLGLVIPTKVLSFNDIYSMVDQYQLSLACLTADKPPYGYANQPAVHDLSTVSFYQSLAVAAQYNLDEVWLDLGLTYPHKIGESVCIDKSQLMSVTQ